MLIGAIALIMLVVGGVAVMSAIMQENAAVIGTGVTVGTHSNERVKEDVDLVFDGQTLMLHNAGPDVEILEYRVLDDDGALLRVCPVRQEAGPVREAVNTTTFEACWQEFLN